MAKISLFTYGLLKSKYSPPDTTSKVEMDIIHGDLYDGDDAYGINLGNSENLILGETQEIEESELSSLDKIEAPEFKRVRVKTIKNKNAWAYEYRGKISRNATLLQEWHRKKDCE